MIRKASLVGASIVMVLALAACGAPKQGTVHDKRYSEGYYSTYFMCASYNTDGICTVNIPQQQWNPPSWALDIYNGDDHGWRSVTEGTYNSVQVGDYVNLEK